MALLKQSADKKAAREGNRAQQQAQREKAAFDASPLGRARQAKIAGHRFFQLVIPVETVDRTALAKASHEMTSSVRDLSDLVGLALTAVEAEGWDLVTAGYTFRQTGGASRDKLLASGQQIAVTGETLGVYLFRLGRAS